jgi:hypothetical protein
VSDDTARRKQLAAEAILDSEGLTDDLRDAAAKRLLKWGVAQAERLATQAADDDVDRVVSDLRRLVKRVNNLVADRTSLTDEEFAAALDELTAAAGHLTGLHVQSQVVAQSLLTGRGRLDEAAMVEQIIALLTTPSESGSGTSADEEEHNPRQGCLSRILQFWRS